MRTTFYKFLHPKEAFITHGVLKKEIVRAAKGLPKRPDATEINKNQYVRRYMDTQEDTKEDHSGLSFVYPYGSTLNVVKPAVPVLSTGPISYPSNRPVAAAVRNKKTSGKLFVLGSV